MEIHLKIKDVLGMDDSKRHILYVESEDFAQCLLEKKEWLYQILFKQHILKEEGGRVLSEMIDNKDIRNTIYMQEKAKRERNGGL